MSAQEGGGEAGGPVVIGEAGLAVEPDEANTSISPDEEPPNEQQTYDVIIIGGGLFSCCLHYFLKKKKPDITILILEKEQTLGGYIKTEWLEHQGKKFLCELGPTILKISDESYQLLNELNLLSHVRVLNKNLLRRYKKLTEYDEDVSVEGYMRENFDMEHFNFLFLPLIYGSCGGMGSISAISFFSRNLKMFDNNLNKLRIWQDRLSQQRMGGGVCRVDSLSGGEVGCAAPPPNEGKLPNIEKHISINQQHSYAQRMNQKYDPSFFNNVLHRLDTSTGDTIPGDLIGGSSRISESTGDHDSDSHQNNNPANDKWTTKHHAGMDTMKGQRAFVHTSLVEVFLHFVEYIYAKCKGAVLQTMLLLYPELAKKGSKQYEQNKKKKILGKTISLKYGMYEIIDQLKKNINKKYVWTNEEVDFVEKHDEDTWVCTIRRKHSSKTSCVYGRNVILTVNSKTCANIMRKILPPKMKTNLTNVQYSNIISVTVYYHKKDITLPRNCFGFLSADKTNHILGCFYTSNMFKERCNDDSVVVLTLYMGGQNNPNDIYMEEKDIIQIVSKEMTKIFHVEKNAQPVILKVKKWFDSIPFYSHNYERNLKCFLNELDNPQYRNLFVDSGWITGTSISDRIASARDLSEFMAANVFPVKTQCGNAVLV